MNNLFALLERLEQERIYYRLNKVNENLMVEIAIPGERWEIEILKDGTMQAERFISTGEILGNVELSDLMQKLL